MEGSVKVESTFLCLLSSDSRRFPKKSLLTAHLTNLVEPMDWTATARGQVKHKLCLFKRDRREEMLTTLGISHSFDTFSLDLVPAKVTELQWAQVGP